ncbi:MAG: inositol monophosphatase [Pirellulales bacterium]|nr:inositol monophosphatase [Pirellulales bacterium]
MESLTETLLETSRQAALAAGETLLDWRGKFQVREKAPADLVTDADLAAQQATQNLIASRHPTHGFLGEEGVDLSGEDSRFRWIVDPLDGTVNYAHGAPGYCVSVAVEFEGKLLAGAIYDPNLREMYSAAQGQGAHLNGEPISASGITEISQAMVVASFAAGVTRESFEIDNFVDILVAAQSLRRTGSAAMNLAYVAAGRFDGYWANNNHAWDIAAGWLLVQEAGGVIRPMPGADLDLDQPRFIAASTPELADQLHTILAFPQGPAKTTTSEA